MERKVSKYKTLFISLLLISVSFLVGCNGSLNFKKTYRDVITKDTVAYYNNEIQNNHPDKEKRGETFRFLTSKDVDITKTYIRVGNAICYEPLVYYWPDPVLCIDALLKYNEDDDESTISIGSYFSGLLVWYENKVFEIRDFLNKENGREIISRNDWMTMKNMHDNKMYDSSILDEPVG